MLLLHGFLRMEGILYFVVVLTEKKRRYPQG